MAAAGRMWVVAPVYRDVESFLRLRPRLVEQAAGLPNGGLVPSFVVVDDTAGLDPEMAQLAGLADVTVLAPPFNLGHQRALVFGLRAIAGQVAATDVVLTIDADGEDRPEDLPRLLAPLLSAPPEARLLVLARRTRRQETLPFKLLYAGFKIFFRSLTGLLVNTGNFAAYRGWLLARAVFHPHFDLCYSSTLLSLGLPTVFVPCEKGPRYCGRSRMGYFKLIVHGVRMLMPFIDRIAVRALVAFSGTVALGALLAILALAGTVLSGSAVPVWTLYAMLLALLLMVSFVAVANLIVLFTVFTQSRGFALAGLERENGPV